MSQLFPAGGQSTGASASASERWTLREVSFSAALREVASAPQVPPQVSFLCPLPSASFSRFCSPMDILSLSLSLCLGASLLCFWCSFWPPRICAPVFIGSGSEDGWMSLLFSPFYPSYPTSGCPLVGCGVLQLSPSPHISLLFSIPLHLKTNSSTSAGPGLPAHRAPLRCLPSALSSSILNFQDL